jgi:tetratricopeptide (TPR) repeat protein
MNLAIATEWDIDRIERTLSELVDVTLITSIVRHSDGQFVFAALPITLSFAKHQLATFGDLETHCRRRVNRFNEQMNLQQSEVRRFATTFDEYGLQTDNEKRAAILCSRAQSEFFSGNTDAADALFRQAREMSPQSAYVFAMNASYELARNHGGTALEYARKACGLVTRKTGALAYTILARVLDVQFDRVGRLEALESALRYDPQDVILRHQYGVALSRLGKTEEAIAVFSKIIDEERYKTPPRESLIMSIKTRVINLRRLGRRAEANADLKLAEQIIAVNPHLQGQAWHVMELLREKDPD